MGCEMVRQCAVRRVIDLWCDKSLVGRQFPAEKQAEEDLNPEETILTVGGRARAKPED